MGFAPLPQTKLREYYERGLHTDSQTSRPGGHFMLRTLMVDKNPAYPMAVVDMKRDGELIGAYFRFRVIVKRPCNT